MAKRKNYTVTQKKRVLEKAKALREQGLSQVATAKKLGIHVNSYLRWMAETGQQDTAKTKSARPTAKKASKAAPKKAAKSKRTRSQAGRIRYTPEQKKQMKQTARKMLKLGKSKQTIQRKLGVSYETLRKLLEGKRTSTTKTKIKSASNPVDHMAAIRARVLEINNEVVKLSQEKARLQKEMKVVYQRLGKEIMG